MDVEAGAAEAAGSKASDGLGEPAVTAAPAVVPSTPAPPAGAPTMSTTDAAASRTPNRTGPTHAASQQGVPDEIDLLGTAGAPVLKRLAPVLIVLAAAVAVIVWLTRR